MSTQKMRMHRLIHCFSGARSLGVTLARIRFGRTGQARLRTSRKPAEGRTFMNARRYVRFVVWLLTLAVGIGVGTVIGQQSPPTENKGWMRRS
jgi:hypothetical protein